MSNLFSFNQREHGIQIDSGKQENATNAAFASLRIALKNFFSTYHVSERYISIERNKIQREDEERLAGYLSYQEKYLQTIFHFHHFMELLIKDELRLINPILAVKLETNNGRFIMDLINKGIDSGKITNQTVEFMVAVKRLKSLANSENKLADIVKKYDKILSDLNILRNRAWHRGTYVLLYSELDRFIGSNVLPCILDCIESSVYQGSEKYWKYKSPKINLDPITKIIQATSKESINYSEVAFYKAVGLAAYNIPWEFRTLGKYKRAAERKAEAILGSDGYEVLECFVCGEKSLVTYREDDWEYDDQYQPINGWWRIYEVECEECGLKMDRSLGNPKEYGIEIPDLWLGEED
ncbi:hypothetical protein [Peribacillus frigoritolerans]|uniref:hypothetical protein n=1 Tax=Peribacillus castrilensis TaxID=2897690 RepID=UPI002DC46FAF|nr:hypothetical protein [Peribacillus castrilensis]